MNEYKDFSSLPPEDEATFVVYEQRTQEAASKAMKLGGIVAAIFAVVTVFIVFSHDAPKNLMEDDDMGLLKTKAKGSTKVEASDPAPAAATMPAAAPTGAGDEAAADEDTAPESDTPADEDTE